MAFEEYGGYLGPGQLLKKMKNVWEMYERSGIEEPKLKENRKIIKVNQSKNIKYLGKNNIGDEGCSHLSKAHWPNLQEIYLGKIISNI